MELVKDVLMLISGIGLGLLVIVFIIFMFKVMIEDV